VITTRGGNLGCCDEDKSLYLKFKFNLPASLSAFSLFCLKKKDYFLMSIKSSLINKNKLCGEFEELILILTIFCIKNH